MELPTKFIGKEIIFFDEIDSTNNFARELFHKKEGRVKEGTVIVAATQTKGRGQFDRSWHSPDQGGAYLTVILTPPAGMGKFLPAVSLAAGGAGAEALEDIAPVKLSLKYPNDIYLKGKKVGGVLAENLQGTKYGLQSHFVILGIGVNLYTSPSSFPNEIKETASSMLHLSGYMIEPAQFIRGFCIQLEKWYGYFLSGNFNRIMDCWNERMTAIPEGAKEKLQDLLEFKRAGKQVRK
ncbi:MAG: biotin--[acetyl-CoA-carboxylase] ligase [Nitrospinae bacterium]|nr:biotin--[acetyl-CoA-carboxylase] ligase [Nitrospinota bacterium]